LITQLGVLGDGGIMQTTINHQIIRLRESANFQAKTKTQTTEASERATMTMSNN